MWKLLLVLVLSMVAMSVIGYDNVIEYDNNQAIIISTTVYNTTGMPCISCSCNLTVYNTFPIENETKISIWMESKSNGVYSINISDYESFAYSQYIYPFTLVCNDSTGTYAGDYRDGIKVSETLFDFTSAVLAVIGTAIGLLIMSFKIDPQYEWIKKLTFFSSFAFLFGALALGYIILGQSPAPDDFIIMMGIIIAAMLMIIMAVIFLYFKERMLAPVTRISKGVNEGKGRNE